VRQPPTELLVALRRARDLADRDFAEPLTLDSMARAANLSKFHFARAFARVYGETPHAYLSRRRVERAKDMLRAANLTVTEVCMLVGFESLGAFSSRFKELVGVSPTEYRRRVAEAGGPPPIPGCFVLMWTRPAPQQSNREEAGPPSAE
jgi:AraC-like DNA-binding protein